MPLTNLNRIRPRKQSSGFKKLLIRLIVILLILVVVFYLPLRGIYSSAKKLNQDARAVSAAFKQENLDDVRAHLKQMKQDVSNLSWSLNLLFWMRVVPYFGGFYIDSVHFSAALVHELNAAVQIADSLDPYKQELGFTGQPTPGQDRIAQFVKLLDKVTPQLDKISPELKAASSEVSSIDVNKYPEKLGKLALRSQIDTAKNFITGAYFAVTNARPALEVAPSALGEPNPKNYLIIFQNDKELRATGGFMTAYAFMKIDKGHIAASSSDDIYRLDEKLLQVCQSRICPLTPPDPIVKYLPEANGKPRTAWSMRDSNLSPDLATSMKEFEKMYSFLPDGVNFDGILTIDTNVVEQLIKITGPIDVYGTKFSADTDPRCNCSNVIYELESYAQIIEKGENDRKAILGTLMQQILARSLGASTDKLPQFINAVVELANSKHIMFYMHDPKTQSALADLNWTGQIKPYSADFLHVNDSNFAGGKSNLYVSENATLDIDTKNNTDKLTIDYSNPQIYSTWLNGINRDYVRIYVPKDAKLISSKGSSVTVTTIPDDLGKTVFEAFIQVRPQNSLTLSFEYQLPSSFGQNGQYPILIQKQPGTKDYNYTVKVNGQTKQQFNLSSDKELKLGI